MIKSFSKLFKRKEYCPSFEKNLYGFLLANSVENIKNKCEQTELNKGENKEILNLAAVAKNNSFAIFLKHLGSIHGKKETTLPFDSLRDKTIRQNNLRSRKNLSDYVRDKEIILTGPASYLIGANLGQFIEDHSIVVRINFQWPVEADLQTDLGSRINILYHAANGDYPISRITSNPTNDLKYVCMLHNIQSKKLRLYCEQSKIQYLYLRETQRTLSKQTSCNPSTGLIAITHLLSMPIRSLLVLGITCQTSPYYQSYPGLGAGPNENTNPTVLNHRPLQQASYLLALIEKDRRLKVDREAIDIMRSFLKGKNR